MKRTVSRRTFLKLSALSVIGAALGGTAEGERLGLTASPAAARRARAQDTDAAQPDTEITGGSWPRPLVPRDRTLIVAGWGTHGGIGNPYANGYSHQRGGASQMEALFYYTALNNKTYPWLAESYAYNGDATEFTLFLRRGVIWNDGQEFNAHDVVFTYQMLKTFAPQLRDSSLVDNAVQSVEALDTYTVKFTLTAPDYRFHFTFCTHRFDRGIYLVPEHVFSQFTTADEIRQYTQWDPAAGVHPVHTGPYLLARDEADVSEFHLRYSWWAVDIGLINRMPWPEVIQVIPSPDIGQMIINDEADYTIDLAIDTIESILQQAGDHVISHTGLEKPYGYLDWWPISMYFNMLEAPYDNPDVRWAVAYAIDPQTVVDVGYGGAGRATSVPFPEYPGLMAYVDGAQTVLDQYPVMTRDLTKVDQLMIGAGFTKNVDGFWEKDGEMPDAKLWAPTPIFAAIAPAVVEQMQQAGFNAEHYQPEDVWTGMSDGRALLHLFGHGGSVLDPYTTLQMYHSQWQRPTGENCGQNRPRWANTEYDALVEEMGRTSPDDTAKMQTLFNQAMDLWYSELPEVPLVQWFHRIAMNTTYWRNWPTQNNPYNTAYFHQTFPVTLWNLLPAGGDPVLNVNYKAGSPGSRFTFDGSGFPNNSTATIAVNGETLPGTVTTGPVGDLKFQFDAASADPGLYVVTATVNPSATVTFVIEASAPLRAPAPDTTGTIFDVPAGIALDETIHLPLVLGGQ